MFTRNLPKMTRVLLVGKDEMVQNLLHEAMIAADVPAQIDRLPSAEKTLAKIDAIRGQFDVIIITYPLSGISGLDLFRELQKLGVEIPIILLASEGMENIMVEALDTGLSNYVITDKNNRYVKLLSAVVINAVSIDRNRHVRKEAEERVKRLLEQQNIVNHVALGLGETTDLNTIYDTMYTYISPLMDSDVLVVTNFNHGTQILQNGYAMIGAVSHQSESFPPVRLGDLKNDPRETVIRTGAPVNIAEFERIRKQVSTNFLNQEKKAPTRQGTNSLLKITSIINSALYAPMKIGGQVTGVLQVQSLRKYAYSQDDMDLLCSLANVAAVAIQNASLLAEVGSAHQELTSAYDGTLEGWARALELRDQETKGHSKRVVEMTRYLARKMGFEDEALSHAYRGALLHDVGKMGVPDSILHKPGPLDDAEWEIMRQHPVYAYDMLYPIEFLRPALEIPYAHHERWDGTGYPRGLKGAEIPLSARIFAIVDVWDAMTSDRPYRKALPKTEVYQHIQHSANSHFDPEVVKVFTATE